MLMLRAWGLPECIVAFVEEIRKATLLMTKQNHKNKQLGGPRKHWVVTQHLFWFLVSFFFDPCLMGQMDGGPLQDRGEISCSALCWTVENYEEGLIHYRQPCMFFFVHIYEWVGNVPDVV